MGLFVIFFFSGSPFYLFWSLVNSLPLFAWWRCFLRCCVSARQVKSIMSRCARFFMCVMNVVVVWCGCVVSSAFFLPVWLSGWVGRLPLVGVRAWGLPLFGGLPLLLFPCLARLVSAPGCVVPSVAYVGWLFPCLAWLLAARCPLAFPRLCPFLSLCY